MIQTSSQIDRYNDLKGFFVVFVSIAYNGVFIWIGYPSGGGYTMVKVDNHRQFIDYWTLSEWNGCLRWFIFSEWETFGHIFRHREFIYECIQEYLFPFVNWFLHEKICCKIYRYFVILAMLLACVSELLT